MLEKLKHRTKHDTPSNFCLHLFPIVEPDGFVMEFMHMDTLDLRLENCRHHTDATAHECRSIMVSRSNMDSNWRLNWISTYAARCRCATRGLQKAKVSPMVNIEINFAKNLHSKHDVCEIDQPSRPTRVSIHLGRYLVLGQEWRGKCM